MNKKTATICFLGNPLFDTRVTNLYNSLREYGLDVNVLGFEWRTESFQPIKGIFKIYKLHKSNFSLLFYLKYSFLIIKYLLKQKSDYYFAEDIYTLPFVYHIAKIKKGRVIYNSRELFGFLAGLRNKKNVQSLIARIENRYIKKADLVLTTGEMDTEFIKKEYDLKDVLTVRNLPLLKKADKGVNYKELLNLGKSYKVIFYQGVLFEGRGLEIIINSLTNLPETVFVLCGSGEQREKFVTLAEKLGVAGRVFFMGSIDQKELINYTAGADIGLSLIENISKSYYYALPNKLFEYIMAGIPVIVSDLPQMKEVVEKYKVGEVIDITGKKEVSDEIKLLLENEDKIKEYKNNCIAAAAELNWQKEFVKLSEAINNLTESNV